MQQYFANVASLEIAMTPSILKNVVRMPKQRAKQVRTRISYMTSEQLERFLQAEDLGHQLPQRADSYRPAEGFAAVHSDPAQDQGQFAV
jgi:hypothetical protein